MAGPSPLAACASCNPHLPASVHCAHGSLPNRETFALNYDCIVLPIIEWDHRYQRPQHIASAFAADGHRVYWANLTFAGWNARWAITPVRDRVWRLSLPGPADHNRFLQQLPPPAIAACVEALLDMAASESIGEAIILVQQPFWAGVALALAERTGWKIVYDCMDEHEGLTALNQDIVRDERALALAADLVTCTSRKLAAKHEAGARRYLLLPNACEFDHFASPGTQPDPLPGVAGPIIGYYGAIMEWFDLEMVADAARRRPDWTFVVAGAIDLDDVSVLRSLPNVLMPGEIAYADLPAWLHRFDVALIPFRLIPIIQATNPVKFYEYLSAGKPVVSTALPELEPYPEFHELARDGAELVAKAEIAMATDSPIKIARRREWAAQQTWSARYASLRTEVAALWGKASIVIVSYQSLDRIRDCVESIVACTDYPNYEVIIADNASSPEVVDFLRGFCAAHAAFRLVESPTNLGFSGGNNLGLSALADDSEYVILLNNDTVVTRGWLQGLLRPLADPSIGMVGPVTWPNGSANETAVPVPYSDMAGMHAFAAARAQSHAGKHFDLPMLAMYCVALRRDVVRAVGPLDEAYGIGMFEDDDYAMRIRKAGLRVICAEDVFIHHVGRASFGKIKEADYGSLFATNKALYELKWGVAWRRPDARVAWDNLASNAVVAAPARPPAGPQRTRKVSVVLVNYNGLDHLGPCLESLEALDYPAEFVEVIVIDNASRDGSLAWLAEHWPQVTCIANRDNVGFSRACNAGARAASGDLVAFLNNDMRVDADWLNGLLDAMDRDPSIACAGSMIMDWEGRSVEYAGRYDDVFSIAYEPLPAIARPQNAADAYTLLVSGGAMLLERETFLAVGGFDERYFMYHEDVDLCWRLWVAGRRCCFAPRSIVYHRGGASSGKLRSGVVQGWGQKHLLWTVLKNFDDANLRQMLPLLVYFLVERGRWSAESMQSLQAVLEETQAALSSILSDRAAIQRERGATDADIFSRCGHPFAFILRSPMFERMAAELAAGAPASIDFTDPGAVAQALAGWLSHAMRARDVFAEDWQADAREKYLRVKAFESRAKDIAAADLARSSELFADWPDLAQRLQRRLSS